jgi:hypothetical protein
MFGYIGPQDQPRILSSMTLLPLNTDGARGLDTKYSRFQLQVSLGNIHT